MAQPREDWFAIVKAIEDGDPKALLKLTRVITGFLARNGAYQVRDLWDDLVQEVLITLLKAVRSDAIREREAFVNYTGRVTRNKLIDYLRVSKRPGAPELGQEIEAADRAEAVDSSKGEKRSPDQLLDLQTALGELGEKELLVVTEVYVEGRSYQEAADRLGMPLGTLKRLQTQALRALRERMGISQKIDPNSRGRRPTLETSLAGDRGEVPT